MDARRVLGVLGLFLLAIGCASASGSSPNEPHYTVEKPDDRPPATSGIPPDKDAEIKMMLQQREPSVLRCYQDVLNEKHDRAFQGTVKLLITIQPSGHSSNVKVVGGTLNDREVQECLVEKIKGFEFPTLTQSGDTQYEYKFRPAY